jgi:hypothetical protein
MKMSFPLVGNLSSKKDCGQAAMTKIGRYFKVKVRIAITLSLILVFLTSCASPKYAWIHSNSEKNNEYTYNIDVSDCNMYAQKVYLNTASPTNIWTTLAGISAKENAFFNCMQSKGWLKVAEEDTIKKQKSVSAEDKGNQISKANKIKEKLISSELGGKPLDAEAIFMLLKNGEKVALLIIVEEVSNPNINKAFTPAEVIAWKNNIRDKIQIDHEYFFLRAFGKAKNFSIVDRNNLKAIFEEMTFNINIASEETRLKIGNLTGATHILAIKSTFWNERELDSIEYRRLIEVQTGKVIAIAQRSTKRVQEQEITDKDGEAKWQTALEHFEKHVKPKILKAHPDFDSIVLKKAPDGKLIPNDDFFQWAEKQHPALKFAAMESDITQMTLSGLYQNIKSSNKREATRKNKG